MSSRPPRRRSGGSPPAETSWERVATWYDGWVGDHGSAYHQQLAIPAVLDLLQPQPGEEILDVGGGQGVLATFPLPLSAEESGRLHESAQVIRRALDELGNGP